MIKLDFNKGNGFVPAVVQHHVTGVVLMVGFMNQEALDQTEKLQKVTFWSRTKGRLWTKGESSGHFLTVKDIAIDCDQDSILIKAEPCGPTCHTGSESCFGEQAKLPTKLPAQFLVTLEKIIEDRKSKPDSGSYTSSLFKEGLSRIAQKVGEEGVECAIAGVEKGREKLLNESADLIYHLLVLLSASDIKLSEVIDLLEARNS